MSVIKSIQEYRIKYLRWAYGPFADYIKAKKILSYRRSQVNRFNSMSSNDKHVFYLGITEQPNLGDMGQHYCIKRWICENYPDRELEMFESSVITDPRFTEIFFTKLKDVFNPDDIIVIQSGYCTQDLGGDHPLMHRLICDNLTDAKILMMPQTIYFQKEENKLICAENHNKAKNMLFLARDFVSYEMAKEMFPNIHVEAYPDIVTTLIGTLKFNNPRKGVCLCTRNDGEKLYSDEHIAELAQKIKSDGTPVLQKDTQGRRPFPEIRASLHKYIDAEIESYSHYEVTITDRYHGTIFSLCAGTPVIIIKTTDHKVTTGADWFKGIYDDYVYVAKDLDDALRIYKDVKEKRLDHNLRPYFKTEYYDKLKSTFEVK
jgi:Exopolysaccharide biosynthesis protein